MKANKALKRLAKIEARISDVMERYSSRASHIREALPRSASRCEGCYRSGEAGYKFASALREGEACSSEAEEGRR